MRETLDRTMNWASEALVKMDYLTCEALCLEALAMARQARDWDYYARVLLPLQEARRQRRINAAEGVIRLGTSGLGNDAAAWLEQLPAGCVAVTRPHGQEQARTLADAARAARRFVEVLWVDSEPGAPKWTLRSFRGPAVACEIPAPPAAWVGRWLAPGKLDVKQLQGSSPADWFIDATEALGDAALRQVPPAAAGKPAPGAAASDRLSALERCLEVVTDHEIIHQRLGDEARHASASSQA